MLARKHNPEPIPVDKKKSDLIQIKIRHPPRQPIVHIPYIPLRPPILLTNLDELLMIARGHIGAPDAPAHRTYTEPISHSLYNMFICRLRLTAYTQMGRVVVSHHRALRAGLVDAHAVAAGEPVDGGDGVGDFGRVGPGLAEADDGGEAVAVAGGG